MAAVLNHPRTTVILEALRIIGSIVAFNDYKEAFRAAGGLRPLAKLIPHSDPLMVMRVLTCLHHLAMPEKAREAMMQAGVVAPTVAHLLSSNLKISLLAIITLTTLTQIHGKIQEAVCLARGMEPAIKLTQHPNETIALESLKLLANLCQSPTCKAEIPKQAIGNLIKVLNVHEVYANTRPTDNLGPNHGYKEQIQLNSLKCLEALCTLPANQQTVDAYGTVAKYLTYLRPNGTIPFDVFKWNFDVVTGVIKAFTTLSDYRPARVKFMEADGASVLLKFITLPEIFPKSLIEVSATLIAKLSQTEEMQNAMVGSGIQGLLRTIQQYSNNLNLVITVVTTIKNLAADDKNKQTIFEEGGVQLINNLLKSADDRVVTCAAEALEALSESKFLRKVIRLVGISNLIRLLTNSNEAIATPAAATLKNLALDLEGIDAIMNDPSGQAVPALVAMLEYPSASPVEAALGALDNMCERDDVKMTIHNGGGLPTIINLLGSQVENIQLHSLQLLTKLARHPPCRAALDAAQLPAKLTSIKDHPNLRRESSTLLAAYKNAHARVSEYHRDRGQYRNIIVTLKSSAPAAAAPGSPAVPPSITPSGYKPDPDIDAILSKLSTQQLIALINNIARHTNTNLRDFLMKKTTPQQSPAGTPPSTPPPSPTTAAANRPAPLKPQLVKKPPNAPVLSAADLMKGKEAMKAVSPRPKTTMVFEDTSGGRVPISAREILQAKEKLKITRKLQEAGVEAGRKYWDGQLARWHEEFQNAVRLEKNFLKVLYELIEVREYEMSWKRAMKLLNSDTMNEAALADALLKIGLGVKRSIFQTDKGLVTEYEAVILPDDYPIKYILKAILIATR